MARFVMFIMLSATILLPNLASVEAGSKDASSPTKLNASAMPGAEKLVLALYYAWFDENTWRREIVPDMPTTTYHSYERHTIARHVDQAKGAGIDALVLSWLGPNNPTDTNFATLLSVAQEKGFRATIDFETNSPFLGSQEAIVNALKYATSTYTGHPAFLRHQGKPVIMFWRTRQLSVAAWQQIRDRVDPARSAIWIAEGDDPSYLQAFDGIHMYSIAWSQNVASTLAAFASKVSSWESRLGSPKMWVATVMPGYDDRTTGRSDAFVRDRQDGRYYTSTWNGAMATSPDWIVITSFNEWVEGTQIEPSVTYGDKYLNLTRTHSAQFKSAAPTSGSNTDVPVYSVAGGRFFTETNGGGSGGFSVSNDGGVRFWDEFQRLGGLSVIGYPISQRFQWGGFVVQAMQKGVLQWRPETGKAYLVNIFDQLHSGGQDEWLLAVRSVPKQLGPEFDANLNWNQIVQSRLALLDANPAIKKRYFEASDPLLVYGLPTSRVQDFGNHFSMRFQRSVIQQWKVNVPWARAGDVVVANGGDVGKEVGLFPQEFLAPQAR